MRTRGHRGERAGHVGGARERLGEEGWEGMKLGGRIMPLFIHYIRL